MLFRVLCCIYTSSINYSCWRKKLVVVREREYLKSSETSHSDTLFRWRIRIQNSRIWIPCLSICQWLSFDKWIWIILVNIQIPYVVLHFLKWWILIHFEEIQILILFSTFCFKNLLEIWIILSKIWILWPFFQSLHFFF